MAISAKLELRQSQQLVMTPQLQQAIRLLQLSNMELNAFVETELERNPLLERDEDARADRASLGRARAPDGDAEAGYEPEPQSSISTRQSANATSRPRRRPRQRLSRYGPWPISGPISRAAAGRACARAIELRATTMRRLEAYVASDTSLKDHLTTQLNLAITRAGRPADRRAT